MLTSVAVERFLTPWEEQRVKELVFAMLEELKAERKYDALLRALPIPEISRSIVSNLAGQPVHAVAQARALGGEAVMGGVLGPNAFDVVLPQRGALQAEADPPAAASPPAAVTEVPPPRKRGRKPLNRPKQECKSCKTTQTPEWRKGPDGRNSLCNACGLRWSKAVQVKEGSALLRKEEEGVAGAAAAAAGGGASAPIAGPNADTQGGAPLAPAPQDPGSISISSPNSINTPLSQPPAAAGVPASIPHSGHATHEPQPLGLGVSLGMPSVGDVDRSHEDLRTEDHLLNQGDDSIDVDKSVH